MSELKDSVLYKINLKQNKKFTIHSSMISKFLNENILFTELSPLMLQCCLK